MMFNLAVLISRRTGWDEAGDRYRRAAAAGYIAAMVDLGTILRESGEDVEAAQWCSNRFFFAMLGSVTYC